MRPRSINRLAVTAGVAILVSMEARSEGTGYFGPEKPLEIQPEVEVYYHLDEDFRLVGQLQSTLIPDDSYSALTVSAYCDWLIAGIFRRLISPDLAKTHALNLRLGLQYLTTLNPGTLALSQSIVLEEDFTPRYFLPWSILISNRNRFQERWLLSSGDSFSFRYRGRIQFEREFEVGHDSLTPFVNAEIIWTTPPAMWTQFRMETGLQYGFHWFGSGQIIEANFSVFTTLQPKHSWSPVLGFIWYIYI